jgi:hypothetical protein
VVVVLGFVLVTNDLAVQFVSQFIDGGIEVSVRAFSEKVATFDVHIAFGSLSEFFLLHVVNRQEDFDVDHLVKVSGNSIEFCGHITAQGGGDFKVVAADRQVHKRLLFHWEGVLKEPAERVFLMAYGTSLSN